ncbi:glycosyltransferase family 2 protein [Yoonia sp.]|uniref:glycosyltransferase family 2 protein n=1 Tax=Yoonia sp. TaxID=2212373 RepID=UPI003F72B1FF
MTVSIIIPTYNRPALLQRAVASALAACPQDGEVIVVDDRSDTAIKALRDVTDPRLRITTNTGDKGAAGARNHGIAQAKGDIVMFLDDDDVMVADYPGRVLAAAAGSVADWGFARLAELNGIDQPLSHARCNVTPRISSGLVPVDVPILDRLPAFSQGFWIRRQVFTELGPIYVDQKLDEDSDYCFRLYGHQRKAWFETEPGCIYSRSYAVLGTDAPQLTRGNDKLIESQCHLRTFQRNRSYFRTHPAEQWALIRRCLRFAAYNGVTETPKVLLSDLQPFSLRFRAWLFWQIKCAGKKRYQRRIAHNTLQA